MLKFELETSSSAVAITKPINQPVRWFKISRPGWFGSKRRYTEKARDVGFTIRWFKRFKLFYWGVSLVEVNGNVPAVALKVNHSPFKITMHDRDRGIEIVWHSQNQYVIRDAIHEIARIYVYKTAIGASDADDYVLTVLDEAFDLMLLFIYVFCYKLVMSGNRENIFWV